MKKTAKIFSLLLAILMLAASLALFAACGDSYDEEITVYNWEDYIYSKTELQNDFNEYYKVKTGKTVKVNYSTFDTNETMLTNIINGDAVVDVIAPSEYAIEKLLQHDLLEKIDKTKVSTISNVNSAIYEAVREVFGTFTTDGGETVDITDYFVPYMWGTLGILYNADVVTEADLAKGWGLLWNENGNEALNGKIFMKDSIRDSYCAAVMYLKEYNLLPDAHKNKSVQELINTNDDAMLDAVEELLVRQKDVLKGYEVDFGKQEMISEKGLVDLAWSGDALYAIEEAEASSSAPALDYFVPEVGGNVWFDGWVIPKNAKNKEAANYFIAFLNEPEIAMSNMLEIGYTSAVDKSVFESSGIRRGGVFCRRKKIPGNHRESRRHEGFRSKKRRCGSHVGKSRFKQHRFNNFVDYNRCRSRFGHCRHRNLLGQTQQKQARKEIMTRCGYICPHRL